jgi:DNA (cytosine-5)-methyltransferase 1
MKYVDLFCGIGSFHFSFAKQGWECVMACDINKDARATYIQNYGIHPDKVKDDIVDIDPSTIPPIDILCGGFPCQPWSNIGKKKGFDDTRGTMFYQVMKFVKHHSPKFIVLENVCGLIKHDNGNTFKKIITELQTQNYHVVHKVLTASDYGIPQMRKRLFIVAIRKDLTSTAPPTSTDFFQDQDFKQTTTLKDYLSKNFEKQTAYTIRCGGRHSPLGDKHNWDGYIVDGQEYRLTIEDAIKLQGFPQDSFTLVGSNASKWRMLGNTIPTVFTEIIAHSLHGFQQSSH